MPTRPKTRPKARRAPRAARVAPEPRPSNRSAWWLVLGTLLGFGFAALLLRAPGAVPEERQVAKAMAEVLAPQESPSTPSRVRPKPTLAKKVALSPEGDVETWKSRLAVAAEPCAPSSGRRLRFHIELSGAPATKLQVTSLDPAPREVADCVRGKLEALGAPRPTGAIAVTLVL
ncbi:MAG: hypothetical protein HY791_12455 [Deltaproteobacteria bacterium]|nr:hypothetical protein [Deltaproteobacteria bacterium]